MPVSHYYDWSEFDAVNWRPCVSNDVLLVCSADGAVVGRIEVRVPRVVGSRHHSA